jgi:hypothetical protein
VDLALFLFRAHSGFRWFSVLVALVALIWFALVLVIRAKNTNLDRVAMLAFTVSLDIQVTLGLILLAVRLINGMPFQAHYLLHAVVMVGALAVGHMSAAWKKSARLTRARKNMMVIVVAMVLIFIGVALLPGGMARWAMMG